jgi:uncharacterized membrane protein
MSIQKDLSELVHNGLISDEQSDAINAFYESKKGHHSNLLTLIFGAIGAILIGLAIILILAHNWDQFTRGTRIFIAFIPLLISQGLCAYTLIKRSAIVLWRETTSILLFFAVGTCIAMIAQIYHIPDSGGIFFLTWVGLCIPVIYVMRSSMMSLLCILGITFYNINYGYRQNSAPEDMYYYIYLAAIIPHYVTLLRNKPETNITYIHHWVLALSLLISTSTIFHEEGKVLILMYMCLMAFYFNIGSSLLFSRIPAWANAYKIIGQIGIVIILLISSFDSIWNEITVDFHADTIIFSREFLLALCFALAAIYFYFKSQKFNFLHLFDFYLVFIIFTGIFFINGFYPDIWINLVTLALGVITIIHSINNEKLAHLNFGLLIVSLLIICRFFDTDMSYLIRGLVFAALGIGFFVANYFMLKRLKDNE